MLVMSGTGTQILSGTRDNAGGFATVNSGTLVLAKVSTASVHAVGASATVALTVNGGTVLLAGTGGDQIYNESVVHFTGGTFDLNDRNEAFRGMTGTGGTAVNNGSSASTLTLGTSSIAGNTYQTSTVLANGSGTLAVTKTGLGTQNLNATNTYTGVTTVSEGRLNINGSLASGSAVSVAASSILGGDGIIHGNVSLAGTLLPGQGGTTDRSLLINGNITSTSGANIGFTIDSESSHNALNIGALGSIDLSNAMLTITLNDNSFTELAAGMGANYTSASYYDLITGSTSGMFANITETMTPDELNYFGLSGTQYRTSINGQTFWVREGSISLVAIPEPSHLLLTSFSLLGLMLRRKR
jgi:autotransporter-associated beta strand protein